jgi:hypothetical protein
VDVQALREEGVSGEFLRTLRERVEREIAPLRKYHGDTDPAVRMGLEVLQIAEQVAEQLGGERVSTSDAAARTGWSTDTLQRWARARMERKPLPDAWATLDVEDGTEGYLFRLDSIPQKKAVA